MSDSSEDYSDIQIIIIIIRFHVKYGFISRRIIFFQYILVEKQYMLEVCSQT